MPTGENEKSWNSPASWPVATQWGVMLLLSCLLAAGLEWLRLPAGLLLGPMIAAILLASRGGAIRIAPPLFFAAQGVVGVMIAGNLPVSLFGEIAADWPIFLAGSLSTVLAASFLGWIMARSGALPGTTAIWGSSPGAATVMTLMSEAYGGDMRLVAFMQYMRMVTCAVLATIVARIVGTSTSPAAAAIEWIPPLPVWENALLPLAIALASASAGLKLRIPGGPLILSLTVGFAVKMLTDVPLVFPIPVLALSYALIGWGVGSRFTTQVLLHAARVFPRVLTSILTLIAICAGFGGVLVLITGIDPLSAYLATSPGGVDSVAIIAASTRVDLSFVLSMQVGRFLLVLIAGPATARLLSRPRVHA